MNLHDVHCHWWIQWGAQPAKTSWELLEFPELEYIRAINYIFICIREYIIHVLNTFTQSLCFHAFHLCQKKHHLGTICELRTGHWSLRLLEKHAGKQLQLPRLPRIWSWALWICGFFGWVMPQRFNVDWKEWEKINGNHLLAPSTQWGVGGDCLEVNPHIIQCSMVNPQWMGIYIYVE